MANIALITADKVEVEESREQLTLVALEAVTAGAPVRIDASTGKFRNGNATTSTEAAIYGLATRTVAAGMPLTALRKGVMDGFVLTGNYGSDVMLSDTDARIADTGGTTSVRVGRVIPALAQTLGNSPDKILNVEVENTVDVDVANLNATGANTVPTGGTLAVTDADTLTVGGVIVPQHIEVSFHVAAAALLVDQSFFIANRAYQVVAVKEVHATAETTAATLRVQVTKDTSTDAPGAGANLLTNTSSAGFDLKATANTVQSGTLTATGADLQLAAGDRLSVDFTVAATEGAGVTITVSLKRI